MWEIEKDNNNKKQIILCTDSKTAGVAGFCQQFNWGRESETFFSDA